MAEYRGRKQTDKEAGYVDVDKERLVVSNWVDSKTMVDGGKKKEKQLEAWRGPFNIKWGREVCASVPLASARRALALRGARMQVTSRDQGKHQPSADL